MMMKKEKLLHRVQKLIEATLLQERRGPRHVLKHRYKQQQAQKQYKRIFHHWLCLVTIATKVQQFWESQWIWSRHWGEMNDHELKEEKQDAQQRRKATKKQHELTCSLTLHRSRLAHGAERER
jgi:hypothetical protein